MSDEQIPTEKTQIEQASTEPDAEDEFDMDRLDDMEDMAALLIDALTIPLPTEEPQASGDPEDQSGDDMPRPPSSRQLQ